MAKGKKTTTARRTRRPLGGSVFQRSGRPGWYIKYADPLTGKPRRRYGGDDRESAERALAQVTSSVAADEKRGVRDVTIETFWREVEDVFRGRLSARQFPNVAAQVLRCDAAFRGVSMYRIDRAALEAYFEALRREGVRAAAPEGKPAGTGKLRPLSVSTLTRHKAALAKLWDAAIDRNAASVNPLRRIALGKAQEKEPNFLTVEQVRKLYAHTPATIRAFVVLVGETGARFGEVAGLRWDQLAAGDAAVTFQHTKSGRTRRVPLTERARTALAELRSKRVAPMTGEDLVLAGHPLSHSYVLRTFRVGLKSAGLPTKVRLHDLRHSFASQLVQAGVALSVVAQLLGHSSLVVTSRYARHAPASLAVLAVQELERARDVSPEAAQTATA